jgi:uncharacterized membrane protein SpoIIM required for sporulation
VNSAPGQTVKSFRAEREANWLRLEALLDRAERRSVKALNDADLFALPLLYRATLSSLSVARATSLDRALIDYLEALSLRAYFFIYGTRTHLSRRVLRFFLVDWPAAVRSLWLETLVALAILVAGAIAGYLLVASDSSWFSAIVPGGMAGGRGPDASAAALREVLYSSDGQGFLGLFATFLFTHNAQMAILSFALGFAFCVPTVMLIALNGCVLGAFLQIHAKHGLTTELCGWLSIHGTTELFALVIAGAAGLRVGSWIAFPGEKSRMIAAGEAGRTAATAMIGVLIMLFVAGLLEGIGRQTITGDLTRYGIGGTALLIWITFFYLFRFRDDG